MDSRKFISFPVVFNIHFRFWTTPANEPTVASQHKKLTYVWLKCKMKTKLCSLTKWSSSFRETESFGFVRHLTAFARNSLALIQSCSSFVHKLNSSFSKLGTEQFLMLFYFISHKCPCLTASLKWFFLIIPLPISVHYYSSLPRGTRLLTKGEIKYPLPSLHKLNCWMLSMIESLFLKHIICTWFERCMKNINTVVSGISDIAIESDLSKIGYAEL